MIKGRQMRYDGVRLVIDQHSDKNLHELANRFGLHNAKDAMCGFVALATAYDNFFSVVDRDDISSDDDINKKQLLQTLEFNILPWIVNKRQTYIQQHPDEFVIHGSNDNSGRMSKEMYRSIMASTPELFQYISEHPMINISNMKYQNQYDCRNIAMLHNVLEGPPVNDTSIRFPRNPKMFTSHEELEYLRHERQFWGSDHYVQVTSMTMDPGANTSTSDNISPEDKSSQDKYRLVTLRDFCQLVIARREEWKIILDTHGHYHVLRLSFKMLIEDGNGSCDGGSDASSAHTSASSSKMMIETIIITEFESLKRSKEDSTPQAIQHFMNCLQSALGVDR